jgi:Response regulator containing CheY-like receiver domain and AraC-type DNA-binding domain
MRREARTSARQRGSLFGGFIASYMAVLALPLCILAFFYYPYTTRAVIDREAGWSSRSVEQIRLSWESFLRYARTLPGSLERNQSISFAGTQDADYRRYLIAGEMRKYSAADDYVFDVFLYMKKDGYLFSKNGNAYSIGEFGRPGDGYYFPSWDHAELERDLSGARGFLERPAEEIVAPTNNRLRVISLVLPLSQSRNGNYATVLVLAKEDALLGAMRAAAEERGGDFFVIDPRGRIAATLGSGRSYDRLDGIVALMKPGEGRVIDVAGKPCIAALSRSEPEGWSYLSLFPVSDRLAELRSVQTRSLALVLLLLIAEAAIILVSLKRNFYPLKRLASSLAPVPPRDRRAMNEIAIIRDTLTGLTRQNDALDERLRDTLPKLRDGAVRDMLSGRSGDRRDPRAALEEYGVKLGHKLLSVAVMRVDSDELSAAAAFRDIERLFPPEADGAVFGTGDETVLICSHDAAFSPRDFLERSLSAALPAGASAAVGIGRPTPNATELRASYAQALRAAELCSRCDRITIAAYDDVQSSKAAPLYRINESIGALEAALREEDSSLIDRSARRIVELVGDEDIEPRLARGLYLNAIAIVLEGLRRFKGDDDDFSSMTSLVFYDRYSIEDMREILQASSERLAALVAEDSGDGRPTADRREILAYLEAADVGKGLCLKIAADHFGMKESAFSYRFKRATGETFKEYCERRRIEASKALLRETDENVESIADKVGFSSTGSSSFIRAFKKSVGMTPRRYRESARADSGA